MPNMLSSLRTRALLLLVLTFAGLLGTMSYQAYQQQERDLAKARQQVKGTIELITANNNRVLDQVKLLSAVLTQAHEVRRFSETAECRPKLAAVLEQAPYLANIAAGLPDGTLVCNATQAKQPVHIGDEPYFRKALASHGLIIGAARISPDTGKLILSFYRAIPDEAGKVKGVLVISLDLSWLSDEIARGSYLENASFVLLDAKGTVVIRHPDPEGWAGYNLADTPLFKRLGTLSEGVAAFEETGLDGIRRIYAAAPFADTAAGHLFLWLGIPRDTVTADAERAFTANTRIALALLLVSFGTLWAGAERWFLRPVAALSAAARRLAQGESGARTGLSLGDDEIGRLAHDFDGMAGALQLKETQLIRANHALRVLSAGNRTLLRVKQEQTLLEEMCRAIVEAGGYRLAWVGYVEDGGGLRPMASWGAGEGYPEKLRIGAEKGPAGAALRQGIPVAVRGIPVLPDQGPGQEEPAPSRRYASCLALPLKINGGIGVLNIYAEGPDAFDEAEASLLAEAADDLSFGIATQRLHAERTKLEASLKISEERFRAAAEASLDALFILKSVRDDAGQIIDFEFTDINTRAEELLGMAREKVVGEKLGELLPIVKSRGFFGKYALVVSTGTPLEEEFPVDTPEIRAKWLRQQVVRVDDGIAISWRDISVWKAASAQRKANEIALKKAYRALAALSAGNEKLVRAKSEPDLLKAICHVIVETGGYRLVMVSYARNGPEITPVAWAEAGNGGHGGEQPSWTNTENGRAPIVSVIRSGRPLVSRDILTDPDFAAWRGAAVKYGCVSNLVLPLSDGMRTFGALSIYAAEPDAFDMEETLLLEQLANNLGYGITALRTRIEHDRIAYQHQHHAEILQQSLEDSIRAIANTVEMRDPYTAGHQKRVGILATAIAHEMGLPEEKIHGIRLAATVHDLGKLQIPSEILTKPGRLTDIEYLLIKTHPQAGYDILKNVKFPWPIADIVWQHHEKLDGSGYPQGLKDGQILPEARIMMVADVVEAMAAHRPYRAALGIEAALREIERGRGSAYDPNAVDACLRLFREGRFAFQKPPQ